MATRSPGLLRRGRVARRLVAAALVAFVLAGLTMVFGERLDHAVAAGGDYEVRVDYPGRTRGGMTRDIDIVVMRQGGFDGPVTLALSMDYLLIFEQQGLVPDPTTGTATGDRVEWTFEPPAGDTLRVVLDVRVEPHRFRGGTGRLTVVEDGTDVVSVDLRTTVMP